MIPDCSEVTQYKYHTHAIGFVSAFINFAFKLGMAVCTAVIGWVLAAYGYVANNVQNENVLNAINYTMNLVVGVILIVGAIALYFYNLDKKTYAEILSEVEQRLAEQHAL
jgi:Na+/melibiose symporter-like transporter